MRCALRDQRGMSFVSVAAGIAVVGLTAAVTVGIMGRTVGNQSVAKVDMEVGPVMNKAMAALTAVMRDIGPTQNQGICSMMSTPLRAGGVGRIMMTMLPENSPKLDENWKKAFSQRDWNRDQEAFLAKESGLPCARTAYSRCFSPAEGSGFNRDMMARVAPVVQVEIVPVRSRAGGESQYETVEKRKKDGTPNVVNARDLSFLLRVTVSHYSEKKEKKDRIKTAGFSILWSGEVSCRFKHPPDPETGEEHLVMMSPSGIGSGISENTVFSDTVEAASSSDDLFSVVWEKKNISRRLVNPKTGMVEVDDSPEAMKIAMCTEKVFRCRQKSAKPRSWFQAMHLKAYVAFNPSNDLYSGSLIRAIPRLCFHSEASPGVKACPKTQFTVSDKVADLNNPLVTYDSTRRGVVMLVGDGDKDVCPLACQDSIAPGINHNHSASAESAVRKRLIATHLYHEAKGVQGGHLESDTPMPLEPLACQCCLTKHCQRQGMAMAPCHEQPLEPMDSRVPECEAEVVPKNTLNERLRFHDDPKWKTTGVTGESCLSGTLRQSAGTTRIELKSRPCSQQLPVLCYHMGRFNLARDPNRSVVNATFDGAQKACYELGREIVIDAAGFEGMLKSGQGAAYKGSPRPPVVKGNYDFINNSIVGFFVAPETEEQMARLADIEKPALDSVGEFWVALRADANQIVRSTLPLAVPTPSPWAVYYEGPLTRFAKDDGAPLADTPSRLMTESERKATGSPPGSRVHTPKAMAVIHSRSHYGAYAVDADQKSVRLPGLCYRASGELVLSSAVSRIQDVVCPTGSYFVPPMTPMQWMHALVRIGPPHAEHPWPRTTAVAWVALKPLDGVTSNFDQDSSWGYVTNYRYGTKGRILATGANKDAEPATYSVCYKASTGWELEIRHGAKRCGAGLYYLNRTPTLLSEIQLRITIEQRGLGASTIYDLKGVP